MFGKILLITLILGGMAAVMAFCAVWIEKKEEEINHVREDETQGQEPENGGPAAAGGAVLPERRGQKQGEEIKP